MSLSDFILTTLVLIGIALILWVYEINPYSKTLHIYTQSCDNMILDNTYCKGNWVDNPTSIFYIDKKNNTVTHTDANHSVNKTYANCLVADRKNWSCNDDITENIIAIEDGKLKFNETSDLRQITRFEWLQNKILDKLN